jgi:hypothetical protein
LDNINKDGKFSIWDGVEAELEFPPEKGERKLWGFRLIPNLNLLVLENGRGVERKLEQYLNFFCIQNYNTDLSTEQKLDGIIVEAIPVEDNPVGFLRSNPNLGSFEATIKANEFVDKNYGVLGDLLSGLNVDEEKLVLKISLSSQKRGRNLPEVLVTNLASFIEGIETDDLNQARVSEYDEGKKLKPTKLLGAFHHRKKYIDDTVDDRIDELNKYADNLISDIGNQFKVNERNN